MHSSSLSGGRSIVAELAQFSKISLRFFHLGSGVLRSASTVPASNCSIRRLSLPESRDD
jgi:hypothetical protein